MAGTSAMAAASAGLFVLWVLYGNELEEVSMANAKHVLSWLQDRPANLAAALDPAKPAARTAQPEHATGVPKDGELPKRLETSAAQPPASDTTPQNPGGDTGAAVTGSAATEVKADAGAISTQASSEIFGETPSRIDAAISQLPESAVSPSTLTSSAHQNETEVVQRPQTADMQRLSVDTGSLIAQGDQFLSKPDVPSARLLYQRAAEAGDGRGALRMGMTFDPVFLARWRLRGIRADRTQAIAWYRRASALGTADAELLKTSLGPQMGSASGLVGTAGQHSQNRKKVMRPGQRASHAPRQATAPQHAKRSYDN
jgi:hypothetical protein